VWDQLLPRRADNEYRGYRLALWLFGVVLLAKAAIALNSIFRGYFVAARADGIPLDTFSVAAAQTVVSLFALLGVAHATLCVLGIVALVRYRSLIPFLFALVLLEFLGRRLVLQFIPLARAGTPPGTWVNLGLLAIMVVGLVSSVLTRGKESERDATPSGAT
jgi:hypothetical protein